MTSGIPGYYETHSANDVVWRTAPAARVNGGGKVDHMGGSIVGLRLS